jgi:hypothetical protein
MNSRLHKRKLKRLISIPPDEITYHRAYAQNTHEFWRHCRDHVQFVMMKIRTFVTTI